MRINHCKQAQQKKIKSFPIKRRLKLKFILSFMLPCPTSNFLFIGKSPHQFKKQEKENISNNEIATNKNNNTQTPAISPSVNHPINLKIGRLPVVNSSFTQKLITSADE